MQRVQQLNQWLQASIYDAILISKPENIGYLTEFWGSFGLYLQGKNEEKRLLTDGRYQQIAQALAAKNDFEFIKYEGSVPKEFTHLKIQNLAVEETLTLAELKRYRNWFKGIKIKPVPGVIENLRRVKLATELEILRAAQASVDLVLIDFLKANLRQGMTELELKFKLDQTLRQAGRYGLSFESIVGFGLGSALPHYQSGERKLNLGDNILIDCGVVDRHYCSDMTRNFVFGFVSESYKKDYAILLQSQIKTLEKVKTNVQAKKLDQFCRTSLGDLSDLFLHSLGHGVGIEIHEAPTLAARSQEILLTGDVVTIEPGIYRAGEYGIRIEDTVIVLSESAEILCKTTKDLLSFREDGGVQTLISAA